MVRFVSGIVIGLVLGATASAYAASILGSGTLTGWTVMQTDYVPFGDDFVPMEREVCSNPTVDAKSKVIECN